MVDAELRPLGVDDSGLLRVATLGNMNWCGERFTMHDVVTRREFAHYCAIDPARGDFGFVAERAGVAVGVCWAQCLPLDDAGYGFVGAGIPELSLWVSPAVRGQGLGRQLLEVVVAEGRRRGFSQVSLSVEAENHAKSLYRSVGFTDVAGREADGVMLLRL